MKRLLQRCLAAALAFVVCAVLTGLSVTSALECLLAFAVVYLILGVLQRGGAPAQRDRRDARRSRPRQVRPAAARPRRPSEPARGGKFVYDLDRHAVDEEWARAADSAW